MTYTTDTLATRSRHATARFDPILLVTTGILALTGIVMIYSATKGKLALAGEDPRFGAWGKQRCEDTGPLTKKRMETCDDDFAARAVLP